MVLDTTSHVLHTVLTYLNLIPVKELIIFMVFWEVLVREPSNILSMLIFTLELNGGLNHKMVLLRFFFFGWGGEGGGCDVNLIFLLKPQFL